MFISAIYGIILARGLAEHRFLNCIEFIARKTGASILQLVWDFFVVVSGIVNFLFYYRYNIFYCSARNIFLTDAVLLGRPEFVWHISERKDTEAMVIHFASLGGEYAIHD